MNSRALVISVEHLTKILVSKTYNFILLSSEGILISQCVLFGRINVL